jgi:ABC-type phosphate/phosphonate transport system permease subunit
MKRLTAGAVTGCLIWVILFCICAGVLCGIAGAVAGVTSTTYADSVAGLLEPLLCPDGSKAEIVTHQTMMRDGVRELPATAYEMQCVANDGTVVRPPGPEYAFYWTSLLMLVAAVIGAVLATALAVPAGVFIGKRQGVSTEKTG